MIVCNEAHVQDTLTIVLTDIGGATLRVISPKETEHVVAFVKAPDDSLVVRVDCETVAVIRERKA